MNPLDGLAACAGSWRGTSTLQDPHAGIAEESPSTATVTSQPGGARFDYTWCYQGTPHEGSILFTLDGPTFNGQWTDTWHTGNKPMACSGPRGDTLSVRGTYPAPPGPDWCWRIDLVPEGEKLRLVMWNVWPAEQGGKEELAVEAVYARG
jgi:hypothetical protein